LISAGSNHIPIYGDLGNNYIFNVAKNESITSFYGQGWRNFLCNSNLQTGDFVLIQMTNKSDAPIKVAPCNATTISQISKVQDDNSSDTSSDSSEQDS
jgi:hypothetical protein